jgi:hypothetical protein
MGKNCSYSTVQKFITLYDFQRWPGESDETLLKRVKLLVRFELMPTSVNVCSCTMFRIQVAEFTYTIYSVPDNMYGVYDHDSKVGRNFFC